MKNVFDIDVGMRRLSDGRVNPTYKTNQVILPLLLGFLLQIECMNELKYMLKGNEFRNVFRRGSRLPQIDTIRDTLKVIDLEKLKAILIHIFKNAIKNKVFRNGTIDGYMVATIDGSGLFGSYEKSCSKCLTKEDYHHHSSVIMFTVGDGPKRVVGLELPQAANKENENHEGEMNTAKRLITDVSKACPNLFDIIVYDALACHSKWINHLLDLGLDVVIRAKKNNSIKRVKRLANKLGPVAVSK